MARGQRLAGRSLSCYDAGPAAALLMAKKPAKKPVGDLIVCTNHRAHKNFDIEETLEAGLVLRGSEVKSLRAKHLDLEGAYASIENGEAFLEKMHVGPYEQAGGFGHELKRPRKLLLHRAELERLIGKLATRGYALVPLKIYFKAGRAKVELGLGKGKKSTDRREEIKRELDLREARDAMQRSRSGK
jgi:SsrA-binding protein